MNSSDSDGASIRRFPGASPLIRNCDHCSQPYEADNRYLNRGQGRYCSRACSGEASALNRRTGTTLPCGNCGKEFYCPPMRVSRSKSGLVFCSKPCVSEAMSSGVIEFTPGPKPSPVTPKSCDSGCGRKVHAQTKVCRSCKEQEKIDLWLAGDSSVATGNGSSREPRVFVKRYLIKTRGDACESCGFDSKREDGVSIIQMDHIDGNSTNNLIENLRLLCPNCHAMTPTYGSRNRGSGRAHRRQYDV